MHRWWDAAGWSDEEALGGRPTSRPAVVSWAADEMQVFVIGDDGHLWNIYWDSEKWHHWIDMGGELVVGGEVAASTWGADRIDVFATGADGTMWHRWWDGSEWVAWQRESPS